MRTSRQTERDARDLWRLCLVEGVLDESRARRVVELAIASGRGGTPAVLRGFGRLLRLEAQQRTAQIESATPLDDRSRAVIAAALASRYGTALATTFRVEPRLVSGTRMTVGSDVYDNSVKARLAALEARF
jgi:F-type H+-transporting ATPase subunit delta